MKQLLVSAAAAFLVGVGVGFLVTREPSVDWKDQQGQIQAALKAVFAQQNAPKELVDGVSECMASKVVAYVAENGCALPAPTDAASSLRVVEVCAGSVAGGYFQECLLAQVSK